MTKNEKNLFLELCKVNNPDKKALQRLLKCGAATHGVLGLLFANRVAALAYTVLEKCELLDLVDREFRSSLRGAREIGVKTQSDFEGCLKYLTTELETCHVPYALLKGAYLCGQYPIGCRTSNDIDVLIHPRDAGIVGARLKMAGFKQGKVKNGTLILADRQEIVASKMLRGETVPYIKDTHLALIRYLEVDVNFSLDYKNSYCTPLESMLENSRIVKAGNVEIRTLSPADFVLHLCAHLYKEATTMPWIKMRRDMTFYKYCDIYTMLSKMSESEVLTLIKRVEELSLKTELAYCINSLNAFFGKVTDNLRIFADSQDATKFDTVISPSEKCNYIYTDSNPVTRFFAKDRTKLLVKEVQQ